MTNIENRKKDHIEIVLNQPVEPLPSSFDKYRLPYIALPEIDMAKICTTSELLGKKLSFPFIISSMTGGLEKGSEINKNLAIAAQQEKVGLGLGSMRVIVRYPETIKTFQVRKYCPDVPLFANIGIVQLNYGFGLEEFKKMVSVIEADAIFVHINHLQEAAQPEGDTNFETLLPKLEKIINKLEVPIFAKEVGHGIDYLSAKRLYDIGIDHIDVAGMGGSSWAWIEGYRATENDIGYLFRKEGIPTDEALQMCSKIEGLSLIAGGGIRSGLDIAKAITMGASYATSAKPFLASSLKSEEEVAVLLKRYRKEFLVAMFTCGAISLKQLAAMECHKIA